VYRQSKKKAKRIIQRNITLLTQALLVYYYYYYILNLKVMNKDTTQKSVTTMTAKVLAVVESFPWSLKSQRNGLIQILPPTF